MNDEIHRLKSMPVNWESGGADPPNSKSIEMALEVSSVSARVSFQPDHIDPSTDGGVCFSIRRENRYADIECFNDGSLFAVTSKDDGDSDVWEVQQDTIKAALERIQKFMNVPRIKVA